MLSLTRALLSDKPLFVILTAYSIRASFYSLSALMGETMRGLGGDLASGELVIREDGAEPRVLSTSLFSRWMPPMSDRSRPPETGDGRHFAPTRAPGRVKEVSNVSNPIVKDIRALAQKRHRDETGLFLAEGLKLVGDALDAGWEIQTLVIARAAAGHESWRRPPRGPCRWVATSSKPTPRCWRRSPVATIRRTPSACSVAG